MVIDNLENLTNYEGLHPTFPKAFSYLKMLLESGAADGRHEPSEQAANEAFYVNLMTGTAQPKDDAVAESHRKYIDVQVVIDGAELMCVPAAKELPAVTTDYQEDKDYMLYAPVSVSACHQLRVHAGQFVIFFADELHAPMIGLDTTPTTVRKAVLKVPV